MRLRRFARWVQRQLIPILTVVACSALFLSTFAVVQYTQAQSQREAERLAFDRQSCDRGNILRQTLIDIGEADEQLIRDLLDTLLGARADTQMQRDQLAQFLLTLEPSFDKQEAAVAAITLTDCAAALDKAKEQP